MAMLRKLGASAMEVRTLQDLNAVQGLIIPGGESTSMARLMDIYSLRGPLEEFGLNGNPMWGTCAGMILLADKLVEDRPEPLKLMDLVVHRNAFGRQVDSFETDLKVKVLGGGSFPAVFIRAPIVSEVGQSADVLATLIDGRVVAVRQNFLLGTAFHPELTEDLRFHQYFLNMIADYLES
jgi:5'-phosphate synthase pdxT subunit